MRIVRASHAYENINKHEIDFKISMPDIFDIQSHSLKRWMYIYLYTYAASDMTSNHIHFIHFSNVFIQQKDMVRYRWLHDTSHILKNWKKRKSSLEKECCDVVVWLFVEYEIDKSKGINKSSERNTKESGKNVSRANRQRRRSVKYSSKV